MQMLKMNELTKNVEAISTKELTITNGYKILNGAKYFSSQTK